MKEKIGIVTDSTCDIPKELLQKFGIKVVPLRILYRDAEYRDGVDINTEEVYERLPEEVPTTSLPRPEDVLALLNTMKEEGYTHVICIHLSSGLSGTAQMMRIVAEQIDGLKIKVIDSKSISMGLGLMVLEAARAIQSKMSFDAICSHVQSLRNRLSVYFVLGTLEYLKKGGRIGKVSATIGELLHIKPIITVSKEGIYTTYAKVRGQKQALDRMLQVAKEHISNAASYIAVCYGGAQEEAINFVNQIKDLPNVKELILSTVSPVIGVHTGPGTLGFAVLQSE